MRTSDIPVPRSRTQCSSSRFGSRAASLSRHSPSRRWAVRTAEVSPRRRRRLQTATCAWRRAAGPLPPPPLALQLICGLAGGALGAREARGRGARRRPFCLPRRRSFFFVFCLAAARGASTAAAAAEAAAAAAAEALSEPHRWEARARAGRSLVRVVEMVQLEQMIGAIVWHERPRLCVGALRAPSEHHASVA